jgi:hypothetical protein
MLLYHQCGQLSLLTAVRIRIYFTGGVNVKIANENNPVPADAIEALARCLLPTIRSYFESEEGQREFAEWQARQRAEQPEPAEKKKLRKVG